MRFTPRRADGVGAFDMTPMIDVVFQLIIFFMYTSHFAQMAREPIDLPRQAGDPTPPAQAVTVSLDVDEQGDIFLEGEPASMEELSRVVRAEIQAAGGSPEAVTVLIRADRSIPSRAINRIATRLAGLGVHGWKLGSVSPSDAGEGGGR